MTEKKLMAIMFIVLAIILMAFAYRDHQVITRYNDLVEKYNELYAECTYGDVFIEEKPLFNFNFSIS